MAGNRVEELEAKVRDLEATINGLTDELIETRERLLAIEEEVGPELQLDILEGRSSRASARKAAANGAAKAEADDEAVKQAVDQADGANAEENEGEDNADSESGDDIIVA
jgi:hypothetical protein